MKSLTNILNIYYPQNKYSFPNIQVSSNLEKIFEQYQKYQQLGLNHQDILIRIPNFKDELLLNLIQFPNNKKSSYFSNQKLDNTVISQIHFLNFLPLKWYQENNLCFDDQTNISDFYFNVLNKIPDFDDKQLIQNKETSKFVKFILKSPFWLDKIFDCLALICLYPLLPFIHKLIYPFIYPQVDKNNLLSVFESYTTYFVIIFGFAIFMSFAYFLTTKWLIYYKLFKIRDYQNNIKPNIMNENSNYTHLNRCTNILFYQQLGFEQQANMIFNHKQWVQKNTYLNQYSFLINKKFKTNIFKENTDLFNDIKHLINKNQQIKLPLLNIDEEKPIRNQLIEYKELLIHELIAEKQKIEG